MKIRELDLDEADNLVGILDNEGFGYALLDGGYLEPVDYLDNDEDINNVSEAIDVIREYQRLFSDFL